MAAKATPILRPTPKRQGGAKVAALQPKLTVGPSNDRFEREADRIADRVVNGGSPTAAPPPVISAVTAQRAPVPIPAGPEQTEEETVPPEAQAQRSRRSTGPESTRKQPLPMEEEPALGSGVSQGAQRDAALDPSASDVGPAGGDVPAAVERTIQQKQSGPAPGLDPDTRALMEERMGADLGDVRIHTDSAAGEASDALGAGAFTVGQDVFFAQGEFDPNSTGGQRLIAHEMAHTVQQTGGSAQPKRIQRDGNAEDSSQIEDRNEKSQPNPQKKIGWEQEDGGEEWEIDFTPTDGGAAIITVPELELPEIAGTLKGTEGGDFSPASNSGKLPEVEENKPYERPKVSERRTRQTDLAYEIWQEHIRTKFSSGEDGLAGKLETQIEKQADAAPLTSAAGDKPVYVLRRSGVKATSSKFFVSGTYEELARHDSVVRPMMKEDGVFINLQADHILEDQLDGKDSGENLMLLDASYNMSIGPQISARIDKQIIDTLKKAKDKQEEKGIQLDGNLPDEATKVRREWKIIFKKVVKGTFNGKPDAWWTKKAIKEGEHLKNYQAMTADELIEQGFEPVGETGESLTQINVFATEHGGTKIPFKVSADGKSLEDPPAELFSKTFRGLEFVQTVLVAQPTQTEGQAHQVIMTIEVFYARTKDKVLENFQGWVDVLHDPRLGHGGYLDLDRTRKELAVEANKLSPVEFSELAVTADGTLMASGSIRSTKALLPNLQIPISIEGTDIFVSFPVPTEQFDLGPVQITDASIDLGVGEQGFFMQGSAEIAVDKVGSGTLTARAEQDDILLKGTFDLDLDFLDPASIEAEYSLENDDFEAKAMLGVKQGTLPGVDSGEVVVDITRESFGLTGTLNLGGILAGSTIEVGYTPEAGLSLEGKDIPLPVSRFPGVTNAAVTVRAERNPGDGTWSLSGGGQATFAAAGASGTLDIHYDGEAIALDGRADVARGPASGWIQITATNREIDDEGNPVEDGAISELSIFGRGEASIAFGEILTGTAGLEYTPDGRTIISGEIAIQPRDLFEERRYEKTLLEVEPPEFPIWGVSLAGVGIGVFAFVNAIVRFEASLGPGQLRDTRVNATIDLDHPELATVEGNAQFFVPAFAGMTLDLGGGLRARATVAYVEGRVGLEGMLGIEADASANVNVQWNAGDGFAVESELEANARPKFELGVNASITAGVDLIVTEAAHTWGPWRKTLGEFGPDMEMGVTFPMRWSEKEGLDLSLDNIHVKKPSLDAAALMADAFDTLV